MIHTNFQGDQPFEKIFEGFLPHMGMAAILVI